MGIGEVVAIVSAILAVLVSCTSLIAFVSKRKKETATDAKNSALIEHKLETVCEGVKKIEIKVDILDGRQYQMTQDLARIDASNTALHNRLDSTNRR